MTEQYYVEMGQRIKLRRQELKLTQLELAELIDISNNHMSAIENAKTNPSMDNFIKLCEVLKVTPDYLLLGNMHANNVPQDIVDKLRLCSQSDLELLKQIIELFVNRNQTQWNDRHFI